MNIISRLVFVVIIIGIVSGCAAKMEVKNSALVYSIHTNEPEKKVDLLLEHFETLGILLTPQIRRGNYTVFGGIFPEILSGEYFTGRIRWLGWIVSNNKKREFFAQALLFGNGNLPELVDFSGYSKMLIIVDGNQEDLKDAKINILSSALEYAYSLSGREFELNGNLFISDEAYRKDFVLQYGTKISDMKKIDKSKFAKIIATWEKYPTTKGMILSPIGRDLKVKVKKMSGGIEEIPYVQYVAGINPQLTRSQKFIGITRGAISWDIIGMGVQYSFELLSVFSGNVPSMGLGFSSRIPNRRDAAYTVMYFCGLKQETIDRLNGFNSEILLSKGAYP